MQRKKYWLNSVRDVNIGDIVYYKDQKRTVITYSNYLVIIGYFYGTRYLEKAVKYNELYKYKNISRLRKDIDFNKN